MPRWAIWLFGLGCVGTLAYLAIGRRRPRPRRGNPWRTLKNKRRVFVDDDGRITMGLPVDWHGAHVRDVPELARRWRGIERDEAACAAGSGRRSRGTFGTVDEGARALLDSNPKLEDFIELEAKGAKERAYREWVKRGRRGKKPELAAGDGRFDAINEGLNLRGARRVSTWREALDRTVPPSKRWKDFGPRLELLEDATGIRLNLPEPAEDLAAGDDDEAQCFAAGDRYRDDLVAQARGGRLGADDQAAVPF